MKQNPVVSAVLAYGVQNGCPTGVGAQKKLAEKLGVTRQTVRNWCLKGSVNAKHLDRFVKVTGADPKSVNAIVRRFS